jgi:hypothetical protein
VKDIFFGLTATEWSQIVQNYSVGFAALATAYVAVNGLKTWIQQHNRELSVNLFVSIEEYKHALHATLNSLEVKEAATERLSKNANSGIAPDDFLVMMVERLSKTIAEKKDPLEKAYLSFRDNMNIIKLLWNDSQINFAADEFSKAAFKVISKVATDPLLERVDESGLQPSDTSIKMLGVLSDTGGISIKEMRNSINQTSNSLVAEVHRKLRSVT